MYCLHLNVEIIGKHLVIDTPPSLVRTRFTSASKSSRPSDVYSVKKSFYECFEYFWKTFERRWSNDRLLNAFFVLFCFGFAVFLMANRPERRVERKWREKNKKQCRVERSRRVIDAARLRTTLTRRRDRRVVGAGGKFGFRVGGKCCVKKRE